MNSTDCSRTAYTGALKIYWKEGNDGDSNSTSPKGIKFGKTDV